MTLTFADSQAEIARLVRQFQTNRAVYLASDYKEAQARQQLIDPFFSVLGWDVHNLAHAAPNYLQVEVETALDSGGHKRAPDYTFQLAGIGNRNSLTRRRLSPR